MHRPWARVLFTIGALVPMVLLVGISVYLSMAVRHLDPSAFDSAKPDMTPLFVFLGGATFVAFWQMGMGAWVGIHASGRVDLSSGAKAAWTIACVFVGSLALPIFAFVVLPGAAAAARMKAARAGGPGLAPGYPVGTQPLGGAYPPR